MRQNCKGMRNRKPSTVAKLRRLERATRTTFSRGATEAGSITYEFSQQGVVNAVPEIASKAKSSGANAIFFTADNAGALPILTQLLPERGASDEGELSRALLGGVVFLLFGELLLAWRFGNRRRSAQ